MDDKPVPFAAVTFKSKSNSLPYAVGMTNEKGIYELTPEGGYGNEGAVPGEYLVSFSKSGATQEELSASKFDPSNPAASSARPGMAPPKPKKASFFPKKYLKGETSGFVANVVKGQKNQFDFDCSSKE